MSREIDGTQSSRPSTALSGTSSRRLDPRRLYPAIVFVPLFYVLVQYLPPFAFSIFVLAAAGVALWEFYRVYFGDTASAPLLVSGLLGLNGFLALTLWSEPHPLLGILFLCVLAILAGYWLAPVTLKRMLPPSVVGVFGVCYIGSWLAHLVLLRYLPAGPALVFFVIVTTWLADTGAYYTGVLAGRTPLAPRLSPKKTVEGLLGGMGMAIVAAIASSIWFVPGFTFIDGLVLGIAITLIGLIGDLSESAFKRLSGVKDSSTLIPGHGGVLDRLDSLLLTVPCFYYYVVFVKNPLTF